MTGAQRDETRAVLTAAKSAMDNALIYHQHALSHWVRKELTEASDKAEAYLAALDAEARKQRAAAALTRIREGKNEGEA